MLAHVFRRVRPWVLAASAVALGGSLSLLAANAAKAGSTPTPAGPHDIFAGEWAPVGSRYQVVKTGPDSYEIKVSQGYYDTERMLCGAQLKSIRVTRSGNRLEGGRPFHLVTGDGVPMPVSRRGHDPH
jgi:hypothetical protein